MSTTSPTSVSQARSSSLVPTTITSSVSTPQLVTSLLVSTSSALPPLCYASNVLASPIFPARVASQSLTPALQAMAVPVQRISFVEFSLENLSANPPAQAPSRGPCAGSSSNPPPVPQWPATTPRCQPRRAVFSPDKHYKLSFQVRHVCFLNNYPVAGPGSVLPGPDAPVLFSPLLAPLRFQALTTNLDLERKGESGHPTRHS